MNVLITGGAGFIGSNLALRLVTSGHSVTVLDTLSPQIHGDAPEASPLFRSIEGKVSFVRGSVTDRPLLERLLPDHEVIVHLAAETGTGQSMYEIERYTSANVGGTALMLDVLASRTGKVRRVVVASSRAIYGEGRYFSPELGYVYPPSRSPDDMEAGRFEPTFPGASAPLQLAPTDEESKLHPTSVYGITKQVQEQLVMAVCPSLGLEGVALRYQNVFGPGQSLRNPYTGILSIFSNLILQGKPINVFEDGRESRDFVFIDDVVTATMLAIEHPAAANRLFNVGTGVATSVLEVARTLVRLIGVQVPVEISGNFRIGDIRHNVADTSRIREVLGFQPAFDFEEGVTLFVDWAKSCGVQPSAYEASLEEMRAKRLLR
ncbi:NAD-dependent epimerase/dehydratase family protein [Sphingomonas sp. MAH-20]|uniref:NAD-dependent epimerase/dehydratase family protein n=1 Tax=Sphingomonas horti TaxID=2682842 RepID=A0A6I4J159_9SPHN|nr:NAD-dependent epimerase/dehydratase family protein [Sphingomonas sp. CGMCC 1.13658]MBA2919775.1 NAD-dependent epimerase/dehydratase family protein [Sphingomonas sp. CGMCC 1.13658]MVO78016.1 NAD-dependent epimerase/dehydratase family protein [Sphingomonas horti]